LSKAEILQVLGNPSTKTTFSDNVWYYITQVRKERAYFSVDNMSTTVLKIAFNKNNIVKNYKIYSDEFSIDVEINSDKTSTVLEKDENFIKEFFSSFRRRLLNPLK
jgi:outer membrane protein assembly factor BamE (lipoprotein component of BamABCDE complex)